MPPPSSLPRAPAPTAPAPPHLRPRPRGKMFRASLPYGRKGLPVQALSAVDLAIWDCKAKVGAGAGRERAGVGLWPSSEA